MRRGTVASRMLKLSSETVRILTTDPQPTPVPEEPQPQEVLSQASLKPLCAGTRNCCLPP